MADPLPPIPPRPSGDGGLPPIPARPAAGEGLPPISGRRPAPMGSLRPAAPPPPPAPRGPRRGRRLGVVALVAGAVVAAGTVGGLVGAGIDDDPAGAAVTTSTETTPAAPSVPVTGTLSSAVSLVAPSVVQVRTGVGQGSGVIVAPRGLVVTNEHVVAGASTVEIVTNDGRTVPAEVVVRDARQDLAVLRPAGVLPTGVPVAQEAGGGLRVGDAVFAVGSPYGLQNSVTAGIVSAVNRPGEGGVPMIQTDAPINPGNSGGGLFDLRGRLVGIPTSIRAPIPGNVGIGFAVPVSRVIALLDQVP